MNSARSGPNLIAGHTWKTLPVLTSADYKIKRMAGNVCAYNMIQIGHLLQFSTTTVLTSYWFSFGEANRNYSLSA